VKTRALAEQERREQQVPMQNFSYHFIDPFHPIQRRQEMKKTKQDFSELKLLWKLRITNHTVMFHSL
jgi:hypothetical protein